MPRCPKCGESLVVSARGSDYIAYCPGPDESVANTGCYAEFGPTENEAVFNVENEHDWSTLEDTI